MRCRCSASQESLETMSSRALRRSAGGTLSSRSRMSASAFAFAAFSIIEGLLPGTNIIDLMGFTWNSVTRARRQQCHRKLEHACSFRLEPRLLYELAERRQGSAVNWLCTRQVATATLGVDQPKAEVTWRPNQRITFRLTN